MKKRSYLLIVMLPLLLILSIFIVQVAGKEETGRTAPGGTEDPFEGKSTTEMGDMFSSDSSLAEQYPDKWGEFMTNKYGISYEGSTSGINYNSDGTLTTQDGSKINLNSFKDKGYTLNSDGSKVTLKDSTGKTTEIVNGENVRLEGDNLVADKVDMLAIGGNVITGGVNVRVIGDKIFSDHVDTFLKGNSISSNVDRLEATTGRFSVESASNIMVGCNNFKDVKNSEFIIENGNPRVKVGEGVILDITDCDFRDTTFESIGNESEIKIEGNKYTIKKGILKCSFGNSTDSIIANNTASLDMGFQCFNCMTIEPVGNYYYSENLIKDFGINVPIDSETYKLCLRRLDGTPFDDYDGLIDFVNKKIELNKIVNYLRYPFENDQLLSLLMGMVYEGTDAGNKATMDLDDDFVFINNIFIENNNSNFGLVSYVNNGKYAIYEYNNGIRVKRYGRFNTEIKPDVIRIYNSFFTKENPLIIFENKILKQQGLNDLGTITSARLICRECQQKSYFENKMTERNTNIGKGCKE